MKNFQDEMCLWSKPYGASAAGGEGSRRRGRRCIAGTRRGSRLAALAEVGNSPAEVGNSPAEVGIIHRLRWGIHRLRCNSAAEVGNSPAADWFSRWIVARASAEAKADAMRGVTPDGTATSAETLKLRAEQTKKSGKCWSVDEERVDQYKSIMKADQVGGTINHPTRPPS
eukprot:1187681-Prorocentrum_minimum.AAC.2